MWYNQTVMKRLGLSIFLVMISSICNADDFFNPPPLNPELPPWMQNSAPAGNEQPPQGQAQPAPDSAPADTSGDTTPDEEDSAAPFDFESGSSDGGGAARDQGKSSFQVLDQMSQGQQQDCIGWGSAFLGTKVFPNQSACHNELDQNIENARDSVNNYTDHTEKEVLRGVIRGKIPREKSKDFHLDFSMLKNALSMAAKTGCTCLE